MSDEIKTTDTTSTDDSDLALKEKEDGMYADPKAAWEHYLEKGEKPDLKKFTDDFLTIETGHTRSYYEDNDWRGNVESLQQEFNERQALSQEEKVLKAEATKELEEGKEDVSNVANITQDIFKLAKYGTDKRKAQDALRNLKAPGAPTIQKSAAQQEMLGQAMSDAQKGFSDAERGALAAQNLATQAAAMKRLEQMGQSSNVASGAQQLHANNLRANLELAKADAQARRGNVASAAVLAKDDQTRIDKANTIREQRYRDALANYANERSLNRRRTHLSDMNIMRTLEDQPEKATKYYGDYQQRALENQVDNQMAARQLAAKQRFAQQQQQKRMAANPPITAMGAPFPPNQIGGMPGQMSPMYPVPLSKINQPAQMPNVAPQQQYNVLPNDTLSADPYSFWNFKR